ncbi:MAG TPA: ABC transporter ATP-binding protein [Caulobacteraceae bacterium]|jgi:ABC-2 type transport system ATP-binding protein
MTDDAIVLSRVTSRRGDFQLGPLDWTVPRGAVMAFIGPNGAGKTTTLDLMMGLGQPDGGAIEVAGQHQPKDEVALKARVAYVNPDLNFAAWGKVGRAIDFISGFYADWDNARCARLLAEFGLDRNERVATLSFGARMKLSLVMALSRDAEVLLLDEPTVGLDVATRHKLFGEILDFMKREGRTVVISSHQLADLERLADHVAILNHGKLLTSGRMDELVERYEQIDGRLTNGRSLPALDGVRVLARDGDRVRALLDRKFADETELAACPFEVLARTPLTLEDLFVALVAN